mgnify:CR=1 FL=1
MCNPPHAGLPNVAAAQTAASYHIPHRQRQKQPQKSKDRSVRSLSESQNHQFQSSASARTFLFTRFQLLALNILSLKVHTRPWHRCACNFQQGITALSRTKLLHTGHMRSSFNCTHVIKICMQTTHVSRHIICCQNLLICCRCLFCEPQHSL